MRSRLIGPLTYALCFTVWVPVGGCTQRGAVGKRSDRNNLAVMSTAVIHIKGQPFLTWLAVTPEEQEHGLMFVEAAELAPVPPDPANGLPDGAQRGMLFVFHDQRLRAFWMANTITALDIAYIRKDGAIVKIHTMAPLETRLYPSIEPAQFALEVRAGLLSELGIKAGDRVEIPATVFKPAD